MEMTNAAIDGGKAFDWGKVSSDYAMYRDIYPKIFYDRIAKRNLCVKGQKILDLGTGTGVLPRNMYHFGADWTGVDISENQIAQAKKLSDAAHYTIAFQTVAAEEIAFPEKTFDVITACQCFWYFDQERIMPKLAHMLKTDGRLLFLYMAWLPFEDKIAGASEELILKYNPKWSGSGETKHPIQVADCVYQAFEAVHHEEYNVEIPFTRETWHGRMKACRGVGASLQPEEMKQWENEHKMLLNAMAPEKFYVKHYIASLELKRKSAL